MSVGSSPERLTKRWLVGKEQRRQRSRGDEQSGIRCGDPAESQPRAHARHVEGLQCLGGLLGADRARSTATVDVDEARQSVGSRLAVEVPGGVRRDHRSPERVATEHHLAAESLRGVDHYVQVLDGDVHTPLLGELNARGGNRLKVTCDARIFDVPEVVVEELRRCRLALLGQVQLRLILEQVLAALNGPDLPAARLRDDPLGKRYEVGAPGGSARLQHQYILGVRRSDLDHSDLVVLRRRARS